MMKRIWIVVIVVAALLAMWLVLMYINLSMSEDRVQRAWSEVHCDELITAEAGQPREAMCPIAEAEPLGDEAAYAGDDDVNIAADAKQAAEWDYHRAEAREVYDDLLADHNASLKKFPASVFASLFGFRPLEDGTSLITPCE